MTDGRIRMIEPKPPPAKAAGSARWWALLLRRICLLIASEIEREFQIEPKR